MGTIQHNAVIATTFDEKSLKKIKEWIDTLEKDKQSSFVITPESAVNGYFTVLLGPDGSKEGWDHSIDGDDLRALFISQLEGKEGHWDWVEIGYGELGQMILRGNN